MGIVLAGYLKILMPAIVVIPGMILFAKYPEVMLQPWEKIQPAADKGYVHMLQTLVPVGLRGLFLAALFGAIQSTINSVLNSSATIVTLDIYQRIFKQNATEKNLVRVGIWVSTTILIAAIIMAMFIGKLGESLFVYIQTLYAFFAPPFSAVFLLGILFKRINAIGATAAVFSGFIFGILLKIYLNLWPDLFGPEILHLIQPFSNQALIHWIFCVTICVNISLITKPPQSEQISDQLTLNWKKLNIFTELGSKWYQSVILWWGLFAAIIAGLVIVFSGKLL
jgi:SSS family solute:Na+ symporter